MFSLISEKVALNTSNPNIAELAVSLQYKLSYDFTGLTTIILEQAQTYILSRIALPVTSGVFLAPPGVPIAGCLFVPTEDIKFYATLSWSVLYHSSGAASILTSCYRTLPVVLSSEIGFMCRDIF